MSANWVWIFPRVSDKSRWGFIFFSSTISAIGILIGFDNLPSFILNSDLKGKDLAKLSGVFEIPILNSNFKTNNISYEKLILKIRNLLDEDNVYEAWQFILSWKKNNG